jgi:hypothetical protein
MHTQERPGNRPFFVALALRLLPMRSAGKDEPSSFIPAAAPHRRSRVPETASSACTPLRSNNCAAEMIETDRERMHTCRTAARRTRTCRSIHRMHLSQPAAHCSGAMALNHGGSA